MATKTSKTSKKTAEKPKSGSVQKKTTAVKRAPAKSTVKKPTRVSSSSRSSRSTPAPKKIHQQRAPRPVRQGMSLDRKLDILGMVMTLIGFLTLLTLFSPIKSSLTQQWSLALKAAFGIGVFLFPLGLVFTGLWLILRNFEHIPQFAVERVFGIILLFLNILAVAHFISMLRLKTSAEQLAQAGAGGGYTGAFITSVLTGALGTGGAAIALVAWFLVGVILSADMTVLELSRKLQPLWQRPMDWLIDSWDEFRSRRQVSVPIPGKIPETNISPKDPRPRRTGVAAEPQGESMGKTEAQSTPPFVPTYPATGTAQTWKLPPIEQILEKGSDTAYSDEIDLGRAKLIEETLSSFGAPARVIEINRGPTITQFGVEPDFIESRSGRMRVRVGKIAALADDLALALSARTIRIQAPVPGKSFVGIEVPNEETSMVALRDLMENEAFKRMKSPLRFALGLNVSGHAVAADLAAMPHLLVAGATGSGKSVSVNALICCLLMNNTPDDLRLIMVDPKRVELTGYNGIPHLLAPVVVELERVVTVLQWVTREMDMRYRKLAEAGCRNIQDYNAKAPGRNEKKLPFLVVIIDELADLMMMAPDETERTITRLAQLARATGIHLVISTQRPSVDVVTGLIKANFPARIAFAVASGVDSRVILDQPGAERLLGRGDMLFQAPDAPAPVRLQGVYVSDNETQSLVSYWQSYAGVIQPAPTTAGGIVDGMPASLPLKQIPLWDEVEEEENSDPLYKEAIDLARRQGRASISMLQRRLRIGYTRAARLIEAMEEKGIIGPPDPNTGTREILDYGQAAPPVDED